MNELRIVAAILTVAFKIGKTPQPPAPDDDKRIMLAYNSILKMLEIQYPAKP
jgi:hypothetical protein